VRGGAGDGPGDGPVDHPDDGDRRGRVFSFLGIATLLAGMQETVPG
jgi:hypothetical protein